MSKRNRSVRQLELVPRSKRSTIEGEASHRLVQLADPKVISADTTAQEAAIPWPNEMGLMASFFSSVTAASKRGGHALKAFAERVSSKLKAAKEKVRKYRLFAKTKQMRLELLEDMANLVKATQGQLGRALLAGAGHTRGCWQAAPAKTQQA